MKDKDVDTNTTCLCGHDRIKEHGPFGCDHGCTQDYCMTGEPSLNEGTVERLDEDGIPWL
jgi:hypothetical protein